MKYPVVIHKDADSDFGVTIPDLPGCFSAGDTMEDALANAAEAAECHIEGMLMDLEEVPGPSRIETHLNDPVLAGGVWAVIEVDVLKLLGKSKRVNITLPEQLLAKIDEYASKSGESRSGVLVHAALEYVAAHPLDRP